MGKKREFITPNLNKLGMPMIKEIGFVHSRRAAALPWHTNSGFELTYAFTGEFIWEVDKKSGIERLQLTGGTLGLTPPDISHRGYDSLIAPGELLFIVFDPRSDRAGEGIGFNTAELSSFSRQWESLTMGTASVDSGTKSSCQLVASLLKESAAPDDDSLWQCKLRSAIVQVLLAALSCFKNPAVQRGSASISKVCRYMEDNYSENLSIDDIAHRTGFEKSRFYELFTNEMGQTPGEYFNRLRCRKALALLRETDLSVTEIAFDCGYSSSQYFASVVRKYTGCSPLDYRRRIAKSPLN